MVTRRLGRLGAYDLRDDWNDVCQEIVWSLVRAERAGRGPSDDNLGAYISRAVWNRFASLLRRRHLRVDNLRDDESAADGAAYDGDGFGEVYSDPCSDACSDDDDRFDIDRVNARQAFARLPRPIQELLWARYVEGMTIEALVEKSGRSRASVNRDLGGARNDFAVLLGLAKASSGRGDPAPTAEIDGTMGGGSDEADHS